MHLDEDWWSFRLLLTPEFMPRVCSCIKPTHGTAYTIRGMKLCSRGLIITLPGIVCLRGHVNQLILNARLWVVTDAPSGEICNQITKAKGVTGCHPSHSHSLCPCSFPMVNGALPCAVSQKCLWTFSLAQPSTVSQRMQCHNQGWATSLQKEVVASPSRVGVSTF